MMIDIETAGHVVFVRQKHHGENFMTLFVLFGTDDQELDYCQLFLFVLFLG